MALTVSTRELQRGDRHRWLVLAICCMSILIVGLDNTIVTVALPAIRDDLDASVAQLQWTIDAYTIVLASLLIAGGSTADRLGRARIFKVGLSLFTAGSLLCSVAPSAESLIVFRMLMQQIASTSQRWRSPRCNSRVETVSAMPGKRG